MKVNYTETKSVEVSEIVEINMSEALTTSIKTKMSERIENINSDKNLTIEEKTERIGKVTFESYTKKLITDIHNAIISTAMLADKSIDVNGKSVNTDGKRVNGKSTLADIKSFLPEINEFLESGRVTIDDKKCYVRNMQYIISQSEDGSETVVHEFISMQNFNSLAKSDKQKIGKTGFYRFRGYTINQ